MTNRMWSERGNEKRQAFNMLCSSLRKISNRRHKQVWRQTQRRRSTTLRRSFHLDLFTARHTQLCPELEPPSPPCLPLSPSDSVFLYKQTHDRRGNTQAPCRLAARLRHMTVTLSLHMGTLNHREALQNSPN